MMGKFSRDQVTAYFNYSNRVLNGLGVSLDTIRLVITVPRRIVWLYRHNTRRYFKDYFYLRGLLGFSLRCVRQPLLEKFGYCSSCYTRRYYFY